jgi:hypothetical protein
MSVSNAAIPSKPTEAVPAHRPRCDDRESGSDENRCPERIEWNADLLGPLWIRDRIPCRADHGPSEDQQENERQKRAEGLQSGSAAQSHGMIDHIDADICLGSKNVCDTKENDKAKEKFDKLKGPLYRPMEQVLHQHVSERDENNAKYR